ncbi:ABC transporter ATP-binding protein [Corynebacterium aquilae]|uniref:ABC transporter domain-containing protein n=1 Tax=Corynebacterium aquilae DSM 44791 TaxID=1431546 RepID=A0A1L7CHX6_9CORY|nr:ABC transporter ATP-binding protein [Corynebacterium aquilae]APT85462.1 hypothetical protein CAQU_10825 [Corynebacterium aquilae DSM 44791]
MPPKKIIQVTNLTCAYGDFIAVDQLSFHVNQGEIYALLGTNGAGKTTTLETLEGHRAPTRGEVTIFDEAPGSLSARRRTGTMLQESGFAGELTVKETVALMGKLSGRHDDVEAVVEKSLLGHKMNTKVAQLSGGEKRRLDFATAIFGSPELIFLDEPTNALDPESRAALWQTVMELNQQGSTIVLTTHYLEEAEAHADRIGLIHAGRLAHEGTLAELIAQFPASISLEAAPQVVFPERFGFERNGTRWVAAVDDLQTRLYEVLLWAENNNVPLTQIKAQPSTLNDVFHTLAQERS